MTVKELQYKLNDFDPDTEIMCFTEDEVHVEDGTITNTLDIVDVSSSTFKPFRDKDDVVRFKTSMDKDSQTLVVLEVSGAM